MHESVLQRMQCLAEGQEPPTLTPHAKARAEVQAAFERLQNTLPALHAKLNTLIPGLMGADLTDPDALQKTCAELDDLGRLLARHALTLRDKIAKHERRKD